MSETARSALVIMPEGVEELEAVAPIDLLRRAGVAVTVASLTPEPRVTGRNGIVLGADADLGAVIGRSYDLVLLPGGPGVRHLRASSEVIDLVRRQAAAGGWLAAICAAPTVLHDAGLLEGVPHTAHFSVAAELPGMRSDVDVVRHGRIITSRGAGTAVDFGLALVEALCGAPAAAAVAEAICHRA